MRYVPCRSYQQAQCAPGYKGPLCGACDRGPSGERYGFYSAFTCTRCKSDGLLVFLTILGFLLQVSLLLKLFMSWLRAQRRWGMRGSAARVLPPQSL
jgi:hypothetical protein